MIASESVKQFVKFGIVGFSNTIIGYLIYCVTLQFLRLVGWFQSTDLYIAQFMMFVLSVLWSFYWNNKKVFVLEDGATRNIWKALIKTYLTYAFTSLILAEFLLFIFVTYCGMSEYIAPIVILVVTVPLNFLIQKYWAFK